MVQKLTVSDLLKELDISFPEFQRALERCSLPMRGLNETISASEKQNILEFLKEKQGNTTVSSSKAGQTKRRILVHVQNTRGRREAINVEVRKKRVYAKPVSPLPSLQEAEASAINVQQSAEPPSVLTFESDNIDLPKDSLASVEKVPAPPLEAPSAENHSESLSEAVNAEDFTDHNLATQEKVFAEPEKELEKNKDPSRVSAKENAPFKSKKLRSPERGSKAPVRRSEVDLSALEEIDSEDEKAGIFIPSEHLRSKLVRGSTAHDKKGKRTVAGGESSAVFSAKGKKANKQSIQQKFTRPVAPIAKNIRVHEGVTVQELAEKLSLKSAALIKELMKLGIMARLNDPVESDVIELLSDILGHQISVVSENEIEENFLNEGKVEEQQDDLISRAPVVTVMGHVDHGKTSLLDFIRKTHVASAESGGITQHLGAYRVALPEGHIVFIDTPGHQAFTMMRARGARCTDIVVLVVAADDGIMPQTVEAIQHAKAGNVPIIVAITKSDKPAANPAKIKEALLQHELVCEEWGGDIQVLEVSSVTGKGIEQLLQAILFQAEILELRAPISGIVSGVVLESKMDKGRGPAANVLIQKGTLRLGDMVICGQTYGRLRQMINEFGQELQEGRPSMPVLIYGLAALPLPGDVLLSIANEKKARELTEHRREQARLLRLRESQQRNRARWNELSLNSTADHEKTETLQKVDINLVIKADTHGTLEALKNALLALNRPEIEVTVRGYGVGAVTESDTALAQASQAILIAFNVRADASARKYIEQEQITIHYHSIIYEVIESVKAEISGRIAPVKHQELKGVAEVRAIFRSPKFGTIAGCFVTEGVVKRRQPIRVIRDSKVILESELDSLRRVKEDVTEVRQGMECGIGVRNYSGFLVGDCIEVYEVTEVARNIFDE